MHYVLPNEVLRSHLRFYKLIMGLNVCMIERVNDRLSVHCLLYKEDSTCYIYLAVTYV